MAEARPELKAVEVLTRPSDILFTRRNVQPPSVVYVAAEDQLFLNTNNALLNVTVSMRARVLTPQGKLQTLLYEQRPTSDRATNLSVFPVSEGFLLSLEIVELTGSSRLGAVFVTAGLTRGGIAATVTHQILVQGYVTEPTGVCWPAMPMRQMLDGPGHQRVVVGTDPAAGVEISETVPDLANWRIQSVRFSLATSAVVGTRTVALVMDDGANIFYQFQENSGQVASATEVYVAADFGFDRAVLLGIHVIPLPSGLRMRQGWRIRTVTGGLDPGDNFTAPALLLEEHVAR